MKNKLVSILSIVVILAGALPSTVYAAPLNDNFAGAIELLDAPSQPYSLPYNNDPNNLTTVDVSTATEEGTDPAVTTNCSPFANRAPGLKTVWYKYAPTENTSLIVDTLLSNYDTYIAVWTDGDPITPGVQFDLVACADESNGTSQSLVGFSALVGTTYYIEVAESNGGLSSSSLDVNAQGAYDLVFRAKYYNDAKVYIGGVLQGSYPLASGEEKRVYYNLSGGPVVVDEPNTKNIVSAIRLQSYANNTLYSFAETMGIPSGLLSYKYYFPSYNNIWAPLNSQIRFSNLDVDPTTIKVTIGGNNVWEQQVLGGEEKRLYFNVSGGPVIIESLDQTKKIAAAIRLQSYANNKLYSFAETMGIPAEWMSDVVYFPSYNNIWAPLNSQLRFGLP